MSLCEQWLANRTKNPNTGRTIKPTGKVYKDLQRKCEPQNISQQPLRQKKTKSPEISDADCNKWFNTFYAINPKTNKRLLHNKPTYKKLLKRCGEKPVNNSIYNPLDVISYLNSFLKYIGSLNYFHSFNIDIKNKRFIENPPETDEAYENMWIPLHDLLMSEIVAINNAINGVLKEGIKTFPDEAQIILNRSINALKLSIKWLNDRLEPEIPLNVNWKQKPKPREATLSERQKKAVEALSSEPLEEKAPLIEPLEEKAPLIEPLEEKAPIETITIKEPKTFFDYAWIPQEKSPTIEYIESKVPGYRTEYQYNIIKDEPPKKQLTPEERRLLNIKKFPKEWFNINEQNEILNDNIMNRLANIYLKLFNVKDGFIQKDSFELFTTKFLYIQKIMNYIENIVESIKNEDINEVVNLTNDIFIKFSNYPIYEFFKEIYTDPTFVLERLDKDDSKFFIEDPINQLKSANKVLTHILKKIFEFPNSVLSIDPLYIPSINNDFFIFLKNNPSRFHKTYLQRYLNGINSEYDKLINAVKYLNPFDSQTYIGDPRIILYRIITSNYELLNNKLTSFFREFLDKIDLDIPGIESIIKEIENKKKSIKKKYTRVENSYKKTFNKSLASIILSMMNN